MVMMMIMVVIITPIKIRAKSKIRKRHYYCRLKVFTVHPTSGILTPLVHFTFLSRSSFLMWSNSSAVNTPYSLSFISLVNSSAIE